MADKCFMIQPFDGGKFDKRFEDVFAPAVRAAGLEPYRVDRDPGVAVPIDHIEQRIQESAACFADVSVDNPNVWFELGYSIAVRKDLCLVCSNERVGKYPFDIQHRRIIKYASDSPSDFEALAKAITSRLQAVLEQQATRADIQAITKEPHTAGLTDYEAACLGSIGSQVHGLEDWVPHGMLRREMEKAGYNRLACNVALRGLKAKNLITTGNGADPDGGQVELYFMSENGWDWLARNTHAFNLKLPEKSVLDKQLDDEIPF